MSVDSTRVFQLSDIAQILELPKSTVKNWTIGRPLQITPSLRCSSGTGASNLYEICDLYLIAIAAQLTHDGFTTDVIKEALKVLQPKAKALEKTHSTLLISAPGGNRQVKLVDQTAIPSQKLGEFGRYILNIEALVSGINRRISPNVQEK